MESGGLMVFGGNEVANLYRSRGYSEDAVFMSKRVLTKKPNEDV